MAAHTWVNGEAITASKLNALERKKTYVDGQLDLTTITLAEAVALQEETCLPYVSYYYNTDENQYHFIYSTTYYAIDENDQLSLRSKASGGTTH